MSYVTNVILLWDAGEDDAARLAEVNAALAEAARTPEALVSVADVGGGDWVGGTKHLECGVAIGALNYTELGWIIDAVRAARWETPEAMQLLVKEQDDERFAFRPLDLAKTT